MMSSAHQLMEQLQREGAARFADTGLARSHAGVVRTVRRQRATRTTVLSVASVAVAGAAAFGISNYAPSTVAPAVTPSAPTGTPSADPSVSADMVTVTVAREQRIQEVARSLAMAFRTTEEEAYSAIAGALPPEAGGVAEGWVVAGEHKVDLSDGLASAARQLVGTTTEELEALGVPRSEWLDTVIMASIVQQEAPAAFADQTGVTRVLLNRLNQGMMLQIESPLAYFLNADTEIIGDDGWAVDTPYNTYMYEGLPPTAIGAFLPDALRAATDPADGDWLYFLRKADGNVVVSTTFEEHQAEVEKEYPGTIGD